ncbi:hypothetical protein ACYOEI_20135 [Singulisphaera rosea]
MEDKTLATVETRGIDQERADAEEVMRLVSAGQNVTDPELIRRVSERAEQVRQQIIQEHGIVEWSLELIREARGE